MPFGHLSTRINLVLARLGRTCAVHDRSVGSSDKFGNPTDSYSDSKERVRCVRTYPNRNTEVSTVAGDRHRDNPVFLFPKGEAPDAKARIEYPENDDEVDLAETTTLYEMQAPTEYDSHTESFAEKVENQ